MEDVIVNAISLVILVFFVALAFGPTLADPDCRKTPAREQEDEDRIISIDPVSFGHVREDRIISIVTRRPSTAQDVLT